MSMPKLREQYDQLRLQAKREREQQNSYQNGNGRRGGAADPLTDQVYGEGSTRI